MIIVYMGLFIRLIVLLLFKNIHNFDTESWNIVGQEVLNGHNIYPVLAGLRQPYFPLYLYLEAFAVFLERFGIPFMITLKTIFILFDTYIIYLIFLITGKNKKSAWLYAINPISIFTTAIHGQFDVIPLFFLLLGIFVFIQKRYTMSTFVISLAIAFKTWPVLFILPLVKRLMNNRNRIKYGLILCFIPLITLLIYIFLFSSSVVDIMRSILSYQPVFGAWGISFFWNLFGMKHGRNIISFLTLLFLILYLFYFVKLKHKSVWEEITLMLIFFLSFTPVFGLQWLMWIVPFLIITKTRWTLLLFIVATPYLFLNAALWMTQSSPVLMIMQEITGVATWLWFLTNYTHILDRT